MIDTTEAVRLAAEALFHFEAVDFGERAGFTQRDTVSAAEAAVTAALPALAEQFAALIEARCPDVQHYQTCEPCKATARLVREAAEVTG